MYYLTVLTCWVPDFEIYHLNTFCISSFSRHVTQPNMMLLQRETPDALYQAFCNYSVFQSFSKLLLTLLKMTSRNKVISSTKS